MRTVAPSSLTPDHEHLWRSGLAYCHKLLEAVRSINRGAPFWEADTITLAPREHRVLAKADEYRCSITITNQGAALAVLAPTDVSTLLGQGSCALPPGASRTLKVTGDIYVYSQDGTVIDHQTERDTRYHD